MKSSLSHLPKINQEQILRIAEIIKEVIAPEKIILFGSYAKGKQIEHEYKAKDGTTYEYLSDYDFLVVVKEIPEKLFNLESTIMNKADKYNTPVNLEIHEIKYINKGLEIGEYFFTDIIKEGIVLYDTGNVKFVKSRELTLVEKKEKAQRYFDNWFPQTNESLIDSINAYNRKNLKKATFELHQATESLYYSILLVFTDYKPKIHNLWKLRKKAKPYSEDLFLVFQTEIDKEEEHLFEKLKRGYIDARYRDDFTITENEVQILMERIRQMQSIVEKVCKIKIAEIK